MAYSSASIKRDMLADQYQARLAKNAGDDRLALIYEQRVARRQLELVEAESQEALRESRRRYKW